MWRPVSVVSAVIVAVALVAQAGMAAAPGRAGDPAKALAVLVDTSQAMTPHVNHVRSALKQFVARMQSTHEIALVEFGERPSILTDYTSDPVRLQSGVDRVFARSGAGSHLLDALVETSKKLRTRDGVQQPSIIVITAEGPEFSDRYHRDVVDELKTTGATLHAFVLSSSRGPSLRESGAREREFTLALGAERTGGSREYLLSNMSLEPRLRELASRLK